MTIISLDPYRIGLYQNRIAINQFDHQTIQIKNKIKLTIVSQDPHQIRFYQNQIIVSFK